LRSSNGLAMMISLWMITRKLKTTPALFYLDILKISGLIFERLITKETKQLYFNSLKDDHEWMSYWRNLIHKKISHHLQAEWLGFLDWSINSMTFDDTWGTGHCGLLFGTTEISDLNIWDSTKRVTAIT